MHYLLVAQPGESGGEGGVRKMGVSGSTIKFLNATRGTLGRGGEVTVMECSSLRIP